MPGEPNETSNFVVESIDIGWALVDESSWSSIHDQLETIKDVLRCTTWGEFRALSITDPEILELADDQNGVDDIPPDDDEPFKFTTVDMESYDRSDWLARATADVLLELYEELGDKLGDAFFDCFYDNDDGFAFVETKEQLDAAIVALEAHGYSVRHVGN